MIKEFSFLSSGLLILKLSVFLPFLPFLLTRLDCSDLRFIPIEAETARELLEQRAGQLATLVSLVLVVAGFLMNVMAGKNKLTTETLIRNSHIFPITVFSLSVVAYLIALSTLRDVWINNPTRFNDLFLAGSYMALGVIGLIGFLFWKIISFLDNDKIQKIIRNHFASELKQISKKYKSKGNNGVAYQTTRKTELRQLTVISSLLDDLDNAIQNDDSVKMQNTLHELKNTYYDIFKYLRNTNGGLETLTKGLNDLISQRFLYCCRTNSPETIKHFIEFYDHLMQEFIDKKMPNSFESAIHNLPIAFEYIRSQSSRKPLRQKEFKQRTEEIMNQLVSLSSHIFELDEDYAERNFDNWVKEVKELSYRIGNSDPAAMALLEMVNNKFCDLPPWNKDWVKPVGNECYKAKADALIDFLKTRAPSDSVSPDFFL